jgi:hypothetical protein
MIVFLYWISANYYAPNLSHSPAAEEAGSGPTLILLHGTSGIHGRALAG